MAAIFDSAIEFEVFYRLYKIVFNLQQHKNKNKNATPGLSVYGCI